MAPCRYVCITSSWRKGRVRSKLCVAAGLASAPPLACMHELAASAQPVGGSTQRRIHQNHERALLAGELTCPADVRERLRGELRAEPLPVFVRTSESLLPDAQGCWTQVTVDSLLSTLAALAPGAWELQADGATLLPNSRPLAQYVRVPNSDRVELWAARPAHQTAPPKGRKRSAEEEDAEAGHRERLQGRLTKARAFASDARNESEAERAHAVQAVKRLERALAQL